MTGLFTIGHSNRELEEFTGLLRAAGADLVVDVRRLPGSRRYPRFDEEELQRTLPAEGIGYRRIQELAGLRAKSTDVPPEVNGHWRNQSFHNYADYALSEPFREGLQRLREWGRERGVAVMCSEAVWWRCHRRIIADHLLGRGDAVSHILGGARIDAASLTPGAVVGEDGVVSYPAEGDRARPE